MDPGVSGALARRAQARIDLRERGSSRRSSRTQARPPGEYSPGNPGWRSARVFPA